MKLTLDRKILIGFLSCTIVLMVVAVISFRNSSRFVETSRMVNHTHQVLYEFDQILVNTVNAETGARGFVITGKEEYLDPFKESRIRIKDHIEKARQLTKDNPVQQGNIEEIERLLTPRLIHLERCIDARRKSFEEARAYVASGEGKELQDQIRKIIDNANQIENTLLSERRRISEKDASNFNVFFIVLLTVIAITLMAVYIMITLNLKALRKAEKETSERNWNLTGSGELVKSMQGNKQVKELSQSIINHLAHYLNVQIGGIYVTGESKMNLKLHAAFAFDGADHTEVIFGEGIVGQAAAEKKTILVKDIPQEYYAIDTGFGNVKPKNIIAAPFIFEDEVVGVIELGSVYEFTELQKSYLNLVADSIAIAITSSLIREKTKELLEETQRQAEELEMQQQELRQANEELHAKTEMLEHSEQELKVQQEELQQVNVELEEKANMLEEQKSKLEDAKVEIEKKASEVETTSKYKSEFLANMSHELRTPLNSILICAQLLAENRSNKLGQKEIDYSRNIYTAGKDLLNLINEILDISKIEAGKIELDIAETYLHEIIDSMSVMFSEGAKQKMINFDIRFDSKSLPDMIHTDKQRVEQILKNLLSNAFKFTDKGGKVSLSVSASGKDRLAFSVSDTGLGVPKSKQELIFEAFQQADGSTKRKYGGTGLGLSISRELAHALGGSIQLESEEGKGSTFTLFLPLSFDASLITPTHKAIEIKEKSEPKVRIEPAPAREVAPATEPAVDDRNNIRENDKVILIIEDEKQFAHVLLDFVRQRHYKGIITHEGYTGLSYARHYKPDAILLDIQLPVMEGTEVLKQIKADPELRHIPIQIISAFDRKKEGLELGAFDYINKPVSTGDLQKAFDKIERFSNKKLKKLLIVEDNREHNSAIRELIGNGDVKCFSAYGGGEAYEMLTNETFECVIVDLGLPDMTGFELLEKIKTNDSLNKIPIIVYTGKELKKEDNVKLGKLANTVVLKTADSHERLLDETTLFLHRVESKLPKEKQTLIRKLHRTDEILKDKKILLVDDDIRNIYSLTNVLEEEGVQCITAENGKVAVDMLKSTPGIDMVLMDIMMPEMDGYEATMEIRKIDSLKKLPVIALTAKAMKGDKEKCLAAGMSDYVSKPINIGQLLSLMRVWLYK